jgi:hypothetical protein
MRVEGMKKTVLLLASIAAAVPVACGAAALLAMPLAGQAATTKTATLTGAGDIASCTEGRGLHGATAKLIGKIRGTVFTLGDNAYESGTSAEFDNCYGPTWGKYKARTRPAVGNHEYNTSGAMPYFEYFGRRAGAPGKGYYSYDRGSSWHVVVLNSNCNEVGGCTERSPQGRWLSNDLANNPSPCTLAYFHHPLYASGDKWDTLKVKPLWSMLYKGRAEVIISGHAHRYERYARITPEGRKDRHNGIRQFIVGTGGKGEDEPQQGKNDPRMQVRKVGTVGVLRLSLRADSYSWKFVPVEGESFTDSGNDRCH